jgi:hypothetical protein
MIRQAPGYPKSGQVRYLPAKCRASRWCDRAIQAPDARRGACFPAGLRPDCRSWRASRDDNFAGLPLVLAEHLNAGRPLKRTLEELVNFQVRKIVPSLRSAIVDSGQHMMGCRSAKTPPLPSTRGRREKLTCRQSAKGSAHHLGGDVRPRRGMDRATACGRSLQTADPSFDPDQRARCNADGHL